MVGIAMAGGAAFLSSRVKQSRLAAGSPAELAEVDEMVRRNEREKRELEASIARRHAQRVEESVKALRDGKDQR